ncbi:MAG: hypothetical protein KIT68_02460 [Phycisphaeraceae bacterium]|nr:hypothetical protein [Phycisphaeraceae bacterium]
MGGAVTVLGVRHHGPGSARMVIRALDAVEPTAVLIEGPADATDVLALAVHEDMEPPVALLVYDPERPDNSAYYPFARFSPEWQALRWALKGGRLARFIDLPPSHRPALKRPEAGTGPAGTAPEPGAATEHRPDPLDALAAGAGYGDGEAWWSQLIEERRGGEDPVGLFDAIRHAMEAARTDLGPTPHDPSEPIREAFMRRSIRAAIREGHERIAVVCGAWHAPALTADALTRTTAKRDDEALRGLLRRKTEATWIPWTYERLSAYSGYGAGIASPGWYDHLWDHGDRRSERWMTRVARLMRREGLEASPASVIESVRLADSIAALRGRTLPTLHELEEATLSVLCHGNPLPMRVIERELIVGARLGKVPGDAPTVPLQRDLAALQKSLRLKVSASEMVLDLDLRKDFDLSRSRLLHRLAILGIHWGTLRDDQRQGASTFHEVWTLQWHPEFAVNIIEAARWGNTVAEAAGAYTADRARRAEDLEELTGLLEHVMLADVAGAVAALIAQIGSLSAVISDVRHVMVALPPLARIMRYGNVRGTEAGLVEPAVAGLLARVCAGLLPACGSLDDEAAGEMRNEIDSVHAALCTLDRADFLDPWTQHLRKLGDADIHGLIRGRAWRHLLDTGAAPAEDAAVRLSLALSRGGDPAKAAAWLEGFLGGSGMVLVHDARLLSVVDDWVCSLSRETFEQICPIARRTFATFENPERRQIGQRLARGSAGAPGAGGGATDDYEPARGALVEPVLRMILGELP